MVDDKALSNALQFHRASLYPVQRDAARLLDNLRQLQMENPLTFYAAEIDDKNRLKHVCFALPV